MRQHDEIRNPDLPTTSRDLSWTAIIAGALVALSLSFLVHSLNAGLSLSAFTTSDTGMTVLGIGAMLWYLITTVVAMFIAGWVAGKLASHFAGNAFWGIVHGFLAWSLALVIGLALTTSFLGSIIGSEERGASGFTLQHLTQQAGSESDKALTPSKHTENVANTAGATALATFFIFLFGAVAAGVGGYYGSSHRRDFFHDKFDDRKFHDRK